MRITNITDMSRHTAVKDIGFGFLDGVEYRIKPGETKDIPDALACYKGKDGKMALIPAIDALVRTNQIRVAEVAAPAAAPAPVTSAATGEPKAPDDGTAATGDESAEKSKKGTKKKA